MRLMQRLSVLTALVCLLPAMAIAQDTTGSISGTVTDEQKAVLPGVTILVKQVETGSGTNPAVRTSTAGIACSSLSPGPYRVTAQLQGFRPVVRDQLTVAIGKDLLVDVEMKVGGIEETGHGRR